MINRQSRARNCGPVAIYNTLKLLKKQVTYRYVENQCIRLRVYDPKLGFASKKDFVKAFRHFGLEFKLRKSPKLKEIDSILDRGNAVILRYETPTGGHIVTISSRTKKTYTAWNNSPTNKTPVIYKNRLLAYLSSPIAWMVEVNAQIENTSKQQ